MTTATPIAATTGAGIARRTVAVARAIVGAARRWYRRERDRHHVMQLDDYLLRDIGLKREQVTRDRLHAGLRR